MNLATLFGRFIEDFCVRPGQGVFANCLLRVGTGESRLSTMQLTGTDMRWINRAISEAKKSKHRVRVGSAVVVKKHGSVSHNKIRNSPAIAWQNASTHAEIGALRNALNGGIGASVYVARLGAKGALLPSYPCERCLPTLADAGVRKLVWFDGKKWVKQKLPDL